MKESETMSNTEQPDCNTADGSIPKGDEMKSTFIVRFWRFLEDYLTVILQAFLPCWVVFCIVLFSILKILPEKLSEMENITDMHMVCAAWALLGGGGVVAIGRLIRAFREGVFPKQPVLLLLVLNAVILGGCTRMTEQLQMKGEMYYCKFPLIYKSIDQYYAEQGCYPPQQDMKSLLKTLGVSDHDLAWSEISSGKYRVKTFFLNVKSAEYHAPVQDSGYPYLTLRYSKQLLGKKNTYLLRNPNNIVHMLEIDAIRNEWKAKHESGGRYESKAEPFAWGGVHWQPVTGGDLDEFLLQSRKKQDEVISRIQSKTQPQNQTELQPDLQPQTELQPSPPPSETP